jgi:hypothetical protein
MFLHGVGNGRFSPELEARLLEAMRTASWELRHELMHFAVSFQDNKSLAVVEQLIEIAAGEPSQDSQLAMNGLTRGVLPVARDRVAEFALKLYEGRPTERQQVIQMLRTYGTKKHAAAVRALAGKPAITPDGQLALAELAAKLDQVPDREIAAPAAVKQAK